MYPLTCVAGFNVPARAGKFEICGFTAEVQDTAAAANIALIDDPAIKSGWKTGRLIGSIAQPTEQKYIIVNKVANTTAVEPTFEWTPFESIKTRYGISLSFTNIKQGSFCLYVR